MIDTLNYNVDDDITYSNKSAFIIIVKLIRNDKYKYLNNNSADIYVNLSNRNMQKHKK